MPKRPKQHQLEDLSIIAFQKVLPREWLYREKDKDYGIDGEVEIFEQDGTATGIIFYVQLKATDSDKLVTQKRVRLKNDAINYYKALELPVLIVRYISDTEEIYFKWAHSIDRYKRKKNEETFSFIVDSDNLWNNQTSQEIHSFLKVLSLSKTKNNLFPIKIFFDFTFLEMCSYKPYGLKSKLRIDLSDKEHYIQISSKEKEADLTISVSDKEISVIVLDGVTGAYLHSIDDMPYENIDELIGDIFVVISLALLSFNKNYNAFEILNIFTEKSRSLRIPHISLHFTQLYFSMNESEKAKELWDNVIENRKDEKSEINFLMQLLMVGKNNKLYEEYSCEQLSKNNKDGVKYYNYANFLRTSGRFREAIKMYRNALKYNNHYFKEDYIYSEIGGTLFELHRYKLSSKCYKKSLELKYNVSNEALFADALMLSGEYELAKESFDNYHNNTHLVESEWLLKRAFLNYLINEYQIKSQIRQTKKIQQNSIYTKCGKKSVNIEELQDVLKIDALNPLIWFNLGINYSNDDKWEDAMAGFLICALMNRTDIEAWINAFKCAMNANLLHMIEHIFSVAYQFNETKFEQELYKFFEESKVPYKIIEQLSTFFERISYKEKHQPIIRLFDGKKFRNIYDEFTSESKQ